MKTIAQKRREKKREREKVAALLLLTLLMLLLLLNILCAPDLQTMLRDKFCHSYVNLNGKQPNNQFDYQNNHKEIDSCVCVFVCVAWKSFRGRPAKKNIHKLNSLFMATYKMRVFFWLFVCGKKQQLSDWNSIKMAKFNFPRIRISFWKLDLELANRKFILGGARGGGKSGCWNWMENMLLSTVTTTTTSQIYTQTFKTINRINLLVQVQDGKKKRVHGISFNNHYALLFTRPLDFWATAWWYTKAPTRLRQINERMNKQTRWENKKKLGAKVENSWSVTFRYFFYVVAMKQKSS